LAGLTKQYGPTLDAVIERHAEAQVALAAASDSSTALEEADRIVVEARAHLEKQALLLSEARAACAPGFVAALESAIRDLAMEGASFEVRFSELPFDSWVEDGPSRCDFLYAPASGQPPRPLAKIASGGELSRVMLALKSVLGSADEVETLVFDEVDAGIGGATATAVGRRLRELAVGHQVIVVTHLAQVAVYADVQLVVSKATSNDGAVTRVDAVEGEQRVVEIGRMLSGNDSDASLAHARELLDEARSVHNG
jgi:DNA repair protein RecN (Recombination protein N)